VEYWLFDLVVVIEVEGFDGVDYGELGDLLRVVFVLDVDELCCEG